MGREIEAFRREGRARAMPKNSNKPWTPEDDRWILELAATGKAHVLIGAALGRSLASITGRLGILKTRTARLKREQAANLPEIPVEDCNELGRPR
jgi:hypothetical protein